MWLEYLESAETLAAYGINEPKERKESSKAQNTLGLEAVKLQKEVDENKKKKLEKRTRE